MKVYKRIEVYLTEDEYLRLSFLKNKDNSSIVQYAKKMLFSLNKKSNVALNNVGFVNEIRSKFNAEGNKLKRILENKEEYSGKFGIILQKEIEECGDNLFNTLLVLREYISVISKNNS
ncbi:MAG: hypothetical protein IKO41_00465 [Lachnospiraceae bacterium]|nr:hypothetical protein [Lachnospiraceae bacterium]